MEIRTCLSCYQPFELLINQMQYPVPKEVEDYRCPYCNHEHRESVRGTFKTKAIPVFATGVAILEVEETGEAIEIKSGQLRWETEEILGTKGILEEVIHTAVFERKNPKGEDIRVTWSISLSSPDDLASDGEVEAEPPELACCNVVDDFDRFYVTQYQELFDEPIYEDERP
jgi:DNA-directed RNA polymerase subunit RPC12/RpoP